MRRAHFGIILTVTAAVTPAMAQPPGFGRPQSPPLSPYLNLLNNSNSTGFNYYQLYRPQTEFRSAYQGLNRNLYQTDRQVQQQGESIEAIGSRVRPGSALRGTGHPTAFMSYGSYFSTGNTGGSVR